MLTHETLKCVERIFQAVFGRGNPYALPELKQKFAFDIDLPTPVRDVTTGELTYSSMPNAPEFMTDRNSYKREDWMLPYRELHDLRDVLDAWREINIVVTERVYHSENIHASDPIYDSTNIYGSTNCGQSKNLVYCDGCFDCEFNLACCRSQNNNFCIRVDDSGSCANSYDVVCSNRITNSLFIQDSSRLHECLFCSHISDHEYCIANMQFEKEAYLALKSQIIDWIFS